MGPGLNNKLCSHLVGYLHLSTWECLVKMHILGPHPRPTESESQEVRPEVYIF